MSQRFSIYIRTKEDIMEAVQAFGFVPLFKNAVPGYSIEENVSPDAWFGSDTDGVWEWKGPVIRESGCAYGKFFLGKAVFVSSKWFPDFANWRRDGYDFDARFDDELAPYKDKELFDILEKNAPVISRELKKKGGYTKDGKKGFDSVITRLQHQCYVLISDFVYEKDKNGNPYGWGVAEYSTPEVFFGKEFRRTLYDKEPDESREKIFDHLRKILPEADEKTLARLLR
ncbi:MAG: hypothetical protein IJ930_00070 [Lachnospiraceae bacterium]|nr:hypothetical protein [Lachnospiraceae bacterium]